MIVRIATEGQYEIPEHDVAGLNELDNGAVAACQQDDERQFQDAFQRLLGYVRTHGTLVDDDRLEGSDVILPPADTSLEEAKEEFTG